MGFNKAAFLSILGSLPIAFWYLTQNDHKPQSELVTEEEFKDLKPAEAPDNPLTLKAQNASLSPAEQALIQKVELKFGLGSYEEALQIATELLGQESTSTALKSWLRAQLPVLRLSQAFLLVKTARCEEAMPLMSLAFEDAKRPEALKGLGICQLKLKNPAEARHFFEAYLKVPEGARDYEVHVLLSDIYESYGLMAEASKLLSEVPLQGAAQLGISETELSKRKEAIKARAGESHLQGQANGTHYKLFFREVEHDAFVETATLVIDRALEDYLGYWGIEAPLQPIEITLYQAQDFQRLVGISPFWSSAFYDGRIRVPIRPDTSKESLEKALRHELFHALIAEQLDRRNLPTWVNEGFAQLFECPGLCPTRPLTQTALLIDQAALERSFLGLDAFKARDAYLLSFLMIRAIYEDRGEEGLRILIQAMTKSSPLASDAILRPLGLDFTRLRAQLSRS